MRLGAKQARLAFKRLSAKAIGCINRRGKPKSLARLRGFKHFLRRRKNTLAGKHFIYSAGIDCISCIKGRASSCPFND